MKRFIKSLGYAIEGVKNTYQSEPNFKIHTVAGLLVLILGILLSISIIEWGIVILLIGLVLTAELTNTAIETLANEVTKNYSSSIKKVKDTMAGAVLVIAIAAACIGSIIFIPKILTLIL
ncbi:MAG: diacylglycerol kinase family protein [Flavobacteriales bacterium]|jgi:diacylglycerol kinase|nr:diacylglycerol kinase family protein [Flavobacteriales bacterium]